MAAEPAKPWYLRKSRRWQTFHSVPWKRLWLFVVAVFLLFSVIGFYSDLMNQGQIPYAIVIAIAICCGLNAVTWIVVVARFSWHFLIALIAFQFAMGPLIEALSNWMATAFALHAPSTAAGIRFAGSGILLVVIASYVMFVNYFRVEGRESARVRSELELAHGIQKTLVPPIAMRTPCFEVYGISQPSEKVGGDLVDALVLDNGDMVAYLADIAGHGLPAGILMGMLKTATRTVLLDAASGQPGSTLPLLLEKLNRILPDVKEPQMYATLTAFRLNADGLAWYAMAASPPVLHWSPRQTNVAIVQEEQFPLGLLPVSDFTGSTLEIAAGDLLVVATDGILEVCDRNGEELGTQRLEMAIASHAGKPLADVAQEILKMAEAFGRQSDDQTLLLIRRIS